MAQITRVTVELQLGSEPITGRILPPDTAPHGFAGYVELIAALEQLRQQPQRAVADGPDKAKPETTSHGR